MIEKIKAVSPEREKQIMRRHGLMPGRKVKIISYSNTRNEGWSSSVHKKIVGKVATIIAVHENVIDAINIKVLSGPDDSVNTHMHYKDLELLPIPRRKNIKQMFDISTLDV